MSTPPNDDPADILSRAKRYHYKSSLSAAEYETILEISNDISKYITDNDHVVFVLGSFKSGDREKLDRVVEIIDETTQCKGVTMDQFGSETDTQHLYAPDKFRLLADYMDSIVGVCEHDQGGFLIEQGILTIVDRYTEKAHLFKRRYSEQREKERYSWMQTSGVFELFDYKNRLYEWERMSDLDRKTRELMRTESP